MAEFGLRNEDARLVALALVYHLGRPGSEIDPETLHAREGGLAPVSAALEPQLMLARVALQLTPYQLHRLDEALLGLVNELKQLDLSGGRSSVAGFSERLRSLFPELSVEGNDESDEEQGGSPLDLVPKVVMLRRRLESTVRQASAPAAAEEARAARVTSETRRPWWRRWGRAQR